MMPVTIPETVVREYASPDAFARGDEYFQHGAVGALIRREMVLLAKVEGSEATPYRVRIDFDAAGVADVACTCPYEWSGWCKHVVAVLLTAIRTPAAITERPALGRLLDGLDREQLAALVMTLAEDDAALTERIEALIERNGLATAMGTGGSSPRRSPVDTGAVRKEVRDTIRSAARAQYSRSSYGRVSIAGDMDAILARARSFIQADDGHAALAVLEALTDEYADAWFEVDDSDGEGGYFFIGLGPSWTEAFLSVDLTNDERDNWLEKLDDWQEKASEYGVDDVFTAARVAVEYGLDNLPSQRIPPIAPTDPYGWTDYRTEASSQLLKAALNIFERRGRHDDYLRLADESGLAMQHATMLVRLGRTDEAIAYSLAKLDHAPAALVVARALREAGDVAGALTVSDHGLTLSGDLAQLASWTRDVAEGVGDYSRALSAALIAFRAQPTLLAYQRAEELADDTWPTYRPDLLAWLRTQKTYAPEGQVDVFLYEGLIDDAIAAVAGTYGSSDIVMKVVEAAVVSRPDWAIATACRRAEAIMDAGKAQHYDDAAQWLARARDAYYASDRPAGWDAYRDSILALHGRKYKLVPLIKALR